MRSLAAATLTSSVVAVPVPAGRRTEPHTGRQTGASPMMNGSLHRPWAAKPIRAMTHGELQHLRTVLTRRTPPDCTLLRAVDCELGQAPTTDDGRVAAGRVNGTDDADAYIESDDWALED